MSTETAASGEKIYLKEIFLLLLKKPSELTDEEIVRLIAVKKQITDELYYLSRMVSYGLEQIQAYRAKKKKLAQFSTEELQEVHGRLQRAWATAVEDDDLDEGPDSLYAPPPIDSDEHVIHEILKERGIF